MDHRVPPLVRWALAALALWIVGYEASAALSSHPGFPGVFGDWPSIAVQLASAALCAERARRLHGSERAGWALIALAILVWTAGDAYWVGVLATEGMPPVPSLSDVAYLSFEPLAFAGLVTLLHARRRDARRTVAVDGVVAALAVAAVSAAAVLEPVAETAAGGAWAVATNLAYPIADLVLLGVIVGALAMRGWQLDRTWGLLAAGTLAFWLADSLYLVQTANGTYAAPSLFDVGWTGSTVLYAFAAWQPVRSLPTTRRRGGMREIVLPLLFGLVALSVLVVESRAGIGMVAIGLSAASIAAMMGRLAMTHRLNQALLRESQAEALTDHLTGLGNRRAMTLDMDNELATATDADPLILVLFDLDGFKHYNDSFGHAAGDGLLSRMGSHLDLAVRGRGHAYRMGGDEFCVLLRPRGEVAQAAIEAAAGALRERGEGFDIGCSYGVVALPRETADPSEALRTADQRMYAAKREGRMSAGRQSKQVLVRALAERDPRLSEHTAGVASMAEAVARLLGIEPQDVETIRHAAELHDIGKVAIPDAILHKPGPLDDQERAFIRTHTLIGERIVAAAPSLGCVATLVRSSHERYDGAGYPDGLVGLDIPLGARIVAVCDAFDAMTTDRAYRAARGAQVALAELRRCAGTQFDPVVVEAFCAARAEHGATLTS